MNKRYVQKSKEEKKEELAKIMSDLEAGIRKVYESGDYL